MQVTRSVVLRCYVNYDVTLMQCLLLSCIAYLQDLFIHVSSLFISVWISLVDPKNFSLS